MRKGGWCDAEEDRTSLCVRGGCWNVSGTILRDTSINIGLGLLAPAARKMIPTGLFANGLDRLGAADNKITEEGFCALGCWISLASRGDLVKWSLASKGLIDKETPAGSCRADLRWVALCRILLREMFISASHRYMSQLSTVDLRMSHNAFVFFNAFLEILTLSIAFISMDMNHQFYHGRICAMLPKTF